MVANAPRCPGVRRGFFSRAARGATADMQGCTIGTITDAVFHDNTKAWCGDHCIDPDLIPGVLFCSHKIADESPRLMDLGPTALSLFGVDVPGNMDGRPLRVAVG
jgi:hypothetical protein